MILFITGGARSGKSSHAQKMALTLSEHPVHVATARRWDEDFEKRILQHRQERDERWTNYEEQKEVSALAIENTVCVIDCVTLWLTNFFIDTKNNVGESLHLFKTQIDAIHNKPGTFIIISNEIGMGVHAETAIGRMFTDLQGWANQYTASVSEKVVLMISGIPVTIKDLGHE